MSAYLFPLVCMNILHLVTADKASPSPTIQKLRRACEQDGTCPVTYDKEELKSRLTPLQYHITQERGTERAFSGKYIHWNDEGLFTCVVCGNHLFSSGAKFDSKSGWPSFYDVVNKGNILLRDDTSHGMRRVEAACAQCGAHLGHVFHDGPAPTGLRYCINSAALAFEPRAARSNEKPEL